MDGTTNNATSPQATSPIGDTKLTRDAICVKETKGTFRFDEEVQNDMAVFRSIYIEKWTRVRGHLRIRVTVELL